MKPLSRFTGIATIGAIVSVAAMYGARDGRRPPRDKTRAEVSLLSAPASSEVQATVNAPPKNSPHNATASEPPLTLMQLEARLSASDPGARDLVLQNALPAMVANNAEEIARFAELQTDPQLRELLVRQVAQLWAKTDPERAMAWAMSLPDSPERVATLIDVSLTVAETDPKRAVNLREPEVGNVEPDGVLEGLVQQWAQADFDAALAWTNARPRNAQHDKLLQRLVFVRAASGAPEAAARMVDDSFAEGAQKAEAAAIVAQQWTQTDPGAANAWIAGLDGDTARSALQALPPQQNP